MASHGDKENLIKLTIMHRNYEEVVRQHLYKNNYLEALEVLKSQGNKELFYQFVGVLLQELPRPTIAAVISQGSHLQPSRLLPALVSCNSDEKHVQKSFNDHEFSFVLLNVLFYERVTEFPFASFIGKRSYTISGILRL